MYVYIHIRISNSDLSDKTAAASDDNAIEDLTDDWRAVLRRMRVRRKRSNTVSINMPQPQNMLLPLSPWHNNLTMTSQFWWHFQPTHANCHASVDRARPALLANTWRLARVGQNGCQKTFARAAVQGRWALPLSLVQNIKKLFH